MRSRKRWPTRIERVIVDLHCRFQWYEQHWVYLHWRPWWNIQFHAKAIVINFQGSPLWPYWWMWLKGLPSKVYLSPMGYTRAFILLTHMNSPCMRPMWKSIILFAFRSPVSTVMKNLLILSYADGRSVIFHNPKSPSLVFFSGKCTRKFPNCTGLSSPLVPLSNTPVPLSATLLFYPSSSLITLSWPRDKRRGTDGTSWELNWFKM